VSFTVTVKNVAPTISAVRVLTGAPEEGSPVRGGVTATDPGGADDPLTYDFDFDNDGVYEVSGGANVPQHVFPDDGDYAGGVPVRDRNGGEATGGIVVRVANVAPSFTPPSIDGRALEGTPLTVTVRATDPAGPYDPLTYEFDFGDGTPVVRNGTGAAPHTYADDGTYTVTIRIDDGDGGVATAISRLVVHNVPPTIALQGAPDVPEGEVYTLTLGTVTDPGADTVTQYIVFWGDGTSSQYAHGGNVTHVYEHTLGVHTIWVGLGDEDGPPPRAGRRDVLVTGADVIDHTLFIFGTDGDDHVTVDQQGNGELKVHASFFPDGNFKTFNAADVSRIVVALNGGNDDATVAGNVGIPVILDGGAGDDHLNAGAGPSVLIGGDGNDVLLGGSGRNILIAGRGADRLVGTGNGDDILIGGSTAYDNWQTYHDLDPLIAALAEWNSGRDYATRVENLRNGTGPLLNPAFRLQAGATVFNDADADDLTGGGGTNWFFADPAHDTLRDRKPGEQVDPL